MKAAHDIMNEYVNLGRAWRSREGTVADEFSDLVTAEEKALVRFLGFFLRITPNGRGSGKLEKEIGNRNLERGKLIVWAVRCMFHFHH